MTTLLYEDLSYLAVGAALEVHRLQGPGFLEAVYEKALAHELNLRQVHFESEVSLSVNYKGLNIGEYRADFVIDDRIVIEIKAASGLLPAHEAQAHHYLAVTGLRLAILFNFGTKSLEIKRVIR